jgi:hypothetical protein
MKFYVVGADLKREFYPCKYPNYKEVCGNLVDENGKTIGATDFLYQWYGDSIRMFIRDVDVLPSGRLGEDSHPMAIANSSPDAFTFDVMRAMPFSFPDGLAKWYKEHWKEIWNDSTALKRSNFVIKTISIYEVEYIDGDVGSITKADLDFKFIG